MQDLSYLAENSMTATSQAAGNMMSSNATAMTAPGSQPVTPLPPTSDQNAPNLSPSPEVPVGFTGKPEPEAAAAWDPPPPAWTATSIPEVIRTDAPVPPEPSGRARSASIGVAGPARMSGRAGTTTTVNAQPGGPSV